MALCCVVLGLVFFLPSEARVTFLIGAHWCIWTTAYCADEPLPAGTVFPGLIGPAV